MLFATIQEWQETNPVIQAVHGPVNLFNMFELMARRIFYVLKLEVYVKEGFTVQRIFFIDGYERVFELLNCKEVRSHKLEIFVPGRYIESRQNSIHIVKKIYQERKKDGFNNLIFECLDKTISDISPEDMAQLSKKDLLCIYPSKIRARK